MVKDAALRTFSDLDGEKSELIGMDSQPCRQDAYKGPLPNTDGA